MDSGTPSDAPQEQRAHARIESDLECTLANETDSFPGRVVNLSLGGALVASESGLARPGETLALAIDRPEGEPLALFGDVVRVEGRDRGAHYALRFNALPPMAQEELRAMLKELARARGNGRRVHPRVAHRVTLQCHSQEHFRATLRDISRGGLALQCEEPLEAGAAIGVLVELAGKMEPVELRGQVVHSELLPQGGFKVGVRFSSLNEVEASRLEQLISLLLLVGERGQP